MNTELKQFPHFSPMGGDGAWFKDRLFGHIVFRNSSTTWLCLRRGPPNPLPFSVDKVPCRHMSLTALPSYQSILAYLLLKSWIHAVRNILGCHSTCVQAVYSRRVRRVGLIYCCNPQPKDSVF